MRGAKANGDGAIPDLGRLVNGRICCYQYHKQLVSLGFDPVGSNPVEFAEQIQIDTQKWRKIVNVAGIRVE